MGRKKATKQKAGPLDVPIDQESRSALREIQVEQIEVSAESEVYGSVVDELVSMAETAGESEVAAWLSNRRNVLAGHIGTLQHGIAIADALLHGHSSPHEVIERLDREVFGAGVEN